MFKKGFTLAEVLICLVIIGLVCVLMLQTLNPKKYDRKTNTAALLKVVEFINQASVQIMDLETEQVPAGKFMIKPAGATDYEFAILNTSGSAASAEDVATLFEKHLKYETGIVDFCNNTSYCTGDKIKGARLAGGSYIGFEILKDGIDDCPSYYMPYETTPAPAPQKFSKTTSSFEAAQCWGKLYIDVNGIKGPDALGQDVYVFGLGEEGIVK